MTEKNHCYGCGTQRCSGDAEAKQTCKAWNPDYRAPWEQYSETQVKENECVFEIFEHAGSGLTICDIKLRCNKCKTQIYDKPNLNYCDYCGAKIIR